MFPLKFIEIAYDPEMYHQLTDCQAEAQCGSEPFLGWARRGVKGSATLMWRKRVWVLGVSFGCLLLTLVWT